MRKKTLGLYVLVFYLTAYLAAPLYLWSFGYFEKEPEVLGESEFQNERWSWPLAKADTSIKENPEAQKIADSQNPIQKIEATVNGEVYRYQVVLPSGTVYYFGLQEPEGIKPVVKVRDSEGWFVQFEPAAGNQHVSPTVVDNVIEWEVKEGTLARYKMLEDRVKADYIVNSKEQIPNDKLEFIVRHNDFYSGDTPEEATQGLLDGKGFLTPEIMPDGGVGWFAENGMEIFNFPRPTIKDAEGKDYVGDFALKSLETGKKLLAITISETDVSSMAFPITIDPQVVATNTGGDATALANGRYLLRDSFGNLFAFIRKSGNDLFYKNYNSTTWTDSGVQFLLEENPSSADIDSSGNLHLAQTHGSFNYTRYNKLTVTRDADNTVLSIVESEKILSYGAKDFRPSLIIANKGEGAGKEKVAVAWAMNTTVGGTKRGEIRFLQCDVADDCTLAANWKNADESKNGATDGLPSSETAPGAADVLFNYTAAHTTHHAVLTQVPGRPQRTPTNAKWDDNGTFTNLTNALDDNTGTSASIGGLDSTNDYLYIGDDNKFSRVVVDVGTANTAASSWTVEYFNGASWAAVSNLIDNARNTIVLEEDGSILFDEPSDWATTTVDAATKYWIRLRPSATLSIGVTIVEFDVTDRHSKDLLVVAGHDDTNDLGAAYVIWDGVAGDKWENKPGDTAAPAPWRQNATAIDPLGANYGITDINDFGLSATVDFLNNAVYVGYHICGENINNCGLDADGNVEKIRNTLDLTVETNWTDTGFPDTFDGYDKFQLSLISEQGDIYVVYLDDAAGTSTDENDLVFRKCSNVCDAAGDWSGIITLDDGEDQAHPQAVVSKAFGDTVAIDVIYTTTTTPQVEYERHYVDMVDKTIVVAASGDDAFQRACASGTHDQDIAATTVKLGREAADASCDSSVDSENHIGFRFPNVTVAQGAAISSAYVDFRVSARTGSGAVDFTVYGEDVDNAVSLVAYTDTASGTSDLVANRTRTASSATQTIDFTTISYRIDVTDMVQEIVCRGAANSQPCVGDFNGAGAWASGNALALLLISAEGGASDNFAEVIALDDTATVMLDPTLQINVGSSSKNYSAGEVRILPTDSADLDHSLSTSEFTSVNTNDTDFYSFVASNEHISSSPYPVVMLKINNPNNDNSSEIDAIAIVKSTVSASSKTIFLQAYHAVNGWETKASNSTSAADTDITLDPAAITTDLSNYLFLQSGTTNQYWSYWRVYQDAPGANITGVFSIDYFNATFTAVSAGPTLDQLLRGGQWWNSSGVRQTFTF